MTINVKILVPILTFLVNIFNIAFITEDEELDLYVLSHPFPKYRDPFDSNPKQLPIKASERIGIIQRWK